MATKQSTRYCAIENCTNELAPKATNPICPACRSGLHYWKKKKPIERLERRRKLTVWGNRLQTFNDKEKSK